MDFGLTGKLSEYYLGSVYQQSKAVGKREGVSFQDAIAVKAAEKVSGQTNVTGMSFKDMWQARFPGAYYHTMNASDIPQGIWGRNDFPFEKFFQDNVDESVINWKPNGAEPAMTSSNVQSRLQSIRGQKSIVVPPALEEKMNSDPALAERVMAKVENFIVTDAAMTPDRICSYLIVLDENGEIARFRASSGGGNISGPTEEEQRQFEAEQAEKRKRREEYARLNEESALKRKLQEQEEDRRFYQRSIAKEAALEAYQSSFITSEVNIL